MTTESPVLLVKKDQYAVITLNRPDKFNSVNRPLALLLQEILDDCAQDVNVRAIMLTGSGRAFCAGQDLGEIIEPNDLDIGTIISEHFNPIARRLRSIEKPIVAAINGVAAGAGANLALACDITIAKRSASFTQAFSKIGLIPDSGGTYTLPRTIGFQKASALMMLSDKISADEAERIGMIYQVIDDEDFDSHCLKILKKLSLMPTKGLALTKKVLNQSYQNSFEQQLQLEDEIQNIAGNSHDYHEGVQAFIEKRKPNFLGR